MHRHIVLWAVTFLTVIGAIVIGPIAQNPAYHNFAAQASLWGIPNFFNVMSNLAFLYVGIWGLFKYRTGLSWDGYKVPYLTYCIGVILTAFGSGWYHLFPNTQTLVWDRLPMTLAFMSLFSLILRDFVHENFGRRIFIPALLAGAASILYWVISEQMGVGDLRPYGLVQFLPLMIFIVVLIFYSPRYGNRLYFIMALMFYISAKGAEYIDFPLYQTLGQGFSGHSIKHILAAIGSFYALKIFLKPSGV